MADETVIETRALSKTYRDFWGRPKVRALKALDLEIKQGEIFGLLGPNGSGKTTTIKLLLGLLFPTEGQALIFGKDATDVSKNQRLGYLPEESYLYRFLNAEETLDFYGRLFDIPYDVLQQRIDSLIKTVGLDRARKRQLKEYSKGMTRRIGLAQALINEPELILLDEPTSGLDPIGTREMKDMILRLREQGKDGCHVQPSAGRRAGRVRSHRDFASRRAERTGPRRQLLTQADVTQIRAKRLPDNCIDEIRQVIARHQRRVAQRRTSDHDARRTVPHDRAETAKRDLAAALWPTSRLGPIRQPNYSPYSVFDMAWHLSLSLFRHFRIRIPNSADRWFSNRNFFLF